MSTQPRLEARVSALERRQINTDTRVEEVTQDVTTSLKQISSEITASFKHLSEYTGTIEDRFDKIAATMATKEDIAKIEATMATKEDIAKIEATMATKEDIARIEASINEIRANITTTNQNTLLTLTQILERLPNKP